jgi:hypothetical protein
MNERIKQLAEQARKHYPSTELSGEYWVFDEQLFAQLIVAECGNFLKDTLDDHFAAEQLEEYFYGVEQ